MKKRVWLDARAIIAIHDEQLAEHGGGAGTRDAGPLESALARPFNLAAYGRPDAAALAASRAIAIAIAKNHPFVDGSKRAPFVALELFPALNGFALTANDVDCVATMPAVPSGEMDETALADWIRLNSAKNNSSALRVNRAQPRSRVFS
jgi:death-on-curing protein